MVRKIKLSLIGAVMFISLTSLVDLGGGGDSVFWGWSYGEPSATMSEGGTGNCFQETTARHYIFWIGGNTEVRYRYADCSTGQPLGGWVKSLNGIQ